MPAPPARTSISDTYPNPSNAVARIGFGELWDYVTGLLGLTGNTPEAKVAIGVNTGATGSQIMPSGTTAQRNASPSAGHTRFNTDTATLEEYNGTEWQSIGYLNIPPSGTKTAPYTLVKGDVGEYIQLGTGGAITVPDSIFAEGDVISIFNNTSAGITITCTITTAYIAGTDSDKASVTLATRGVCTILFISSTVCVITGNVS